MRNEREKFFDGIRSMADLNAKLGNPEPETIYYCSECPKSKSCKANLVSCAGFKGFKEEN